MINLWMVLFTIIIVLIGVQFMFYMIRLVNKND